jgi:hypothetical protein
VTGQLKSREKEKHHSKAGNSLQLQPTSQVKERRPKPPSHGKLCGLGDILADLTVLQVTLPQALNSGRIWCDSDFFCMTSYHQTRDPFYFTLKIPENY